MPKLCTGAQVLCVVLFFIQLALGQRDSASALDEFLNGPKAVSPMGVPSPAMGPSYDTFNTSTPSFIFFSLDDALMESSWLAGYERFAKVVEARNPNGCRMPVTWFVSLQGKNQGKCEVAQRAFAAGHELSTHSVMHSQSLLDFSLEEMKADIQGVKDWLVGECGIPADAVVGYRGPYFYYTENTGQALAELGFLYDSSMPDADYTQRAGRWDQGMELVCNREYRRCSNWPQYPLWEVPVYRLPGDDKRTDPAPAAGLSVYQRLEADFMRKRGLGVPVSIATHENYLTDTPDAVAEMIDFVEWALAQPNTWAITYSQYIAHLQNPDVPMEELLAEYPCDDS